MMVNAAVARTEIDCPFRDQPYSIDSPLIDVLLNPKAKAIVATQGPEFVEHMPTQIPTFASITSIRNLAEGKHTPDSLMQSLDASLRSLPVTADDRKIRCARYDEGGPHLNFPPGKPRLLLFQKITGIRDESSVDAASSALRDMARQNGWALVETDKGGTISTFQLKSIDAVIWNNVSGDVLTIKQRDALRHYVETGGGFVAFHGSGGDPVYFWDWYADVLIGARYKDHPMKPQFQEARIDLEDSSPLSRGLAPGWTMTDEWYSFKTNPRDGGAHIIATLDESSYSPRNWGGDDIRMGDHPIAWTRCIEAGRAFYSAIGHRPEAYSDPHYALLLLHAIEWAAARSAPCPPHT